MMRVRKVVTNIELMGYAYVLQVYYVCKVFSV